VSAVFSVVKARSSVSPHCQRAFLPVSRVSGAAIFEKSLTNRRYHEAIPMNCLIFLTVVGVVQSATALIFAGSVCMPIYYVPEITQFGSAEMAFLEI
jgi:hypothetical protein